MERSSDGWVNPFSVDRVEGWRVEEQPENYRKIAALFATPDFMNKLEDATITKAIFVIGGRGCGKSHILRRMAVQSELEALEERFGRKLKPAEFDKKYFGVYLKTDCFSPLSNASTTYLKKEQLEVLFTHFFNMEVSKAIIESLRFLSLHLESVVNEIAICKNIKDYLTHLKWQQDEISSYTDLLQSFDDQVNNISKLIKNILFDDDIGKYLANIYLTETPDFILKIFNIVRSEVTFLKGKSLILLLDEYESLDENQQIIINQIIKSRRLTLRIAVKVRGIKTLSTKTSERLEELHDYDHIDLLYKLDRTNQPKYKALTRQVFENRLSLRDEIGEYRVKDPKKLLPPPSLADEGITDDEIKKELLEIRESVRNNKEIEKDINEYWKNFEGHYKEAAVFRILRQKGKDKLYAGFDEYVSLSSGIMRLFIWLCRESFSLARQEDIDLMNGASINAHIQSQAAKNVANKELRITIPQTVNNLYASKLAYFISDIGQILRAKLYYSSQPQANRIEIINPEKFDLDDYAIPRELIESGQDLPVLIAESSFKPRDIKYPFPKTFSLNGIFAPLFNIPPEGRWRTEIKADELKALCLSEQRNEILDSIVTQIKNKERSIRGKKRKPPQDTTTHSIFNTIQRPITLENCPVTGKGCNNNLLDYNSGASSTHAFLAIPFDDDWVADPRSWIKEGLSDVCQVSCKDISDFSAQGYFLCKICSCVRQYPVGIFEITELNPNVIFELGMAIGLNKQCHLFVFKEKIPDKYRADYPPAPFNGIEYIPYELSSNAVRKIIDMKIRAVIHTFNDPMNIICKIINSKCPHQEPVSSKNDILISCPKKGHEYFDDVFGIIENIVKREGYVLTRHNPAESLADLCQLCRSIKAASFCIVDTTYNDFTSLFALGISFSKDKKFIQLHNTALSSGRPISDLRSWAIEYKNINDLEIKLSKELPSRLGK